jgi:hypothetical protein
MRHITSDADADDVSLLGDNIDTIKKNMETLNYASKEVGLQINIGKTKYILLSLHRIADENRDTKVVNRWFENVSHFKYLGTTTNQNLIQEEIKRRLNSGNACYHSVQNLFLSYHLVSKNVKIEIYQTIILPVVLYGCESWYLDIKGGTWTEGV